MISFANQIRESREEFKKIKWPTRKITFQYSLIVIISVVVATIIFGLIDFGLSKLFTKLFIQG